MTSQASILTPDYGAFLHSLKERIQHAQVRAMLSVNRELVLLYWQIGREILDRQLLQGWGTKVVEQLSRDLRSAFPEMKGLSQRNLKYMRSFADSYRDEGFVQQAAAQIPWFHNCVILDKIKDKKEREFYIRQTIVNGWSRNILALQIESRLHLRQGKAVTNFDLTLTKPQSDLAQDILKDPYNFDFLMLGTESHERDVENALLLNLRKFLLELGVGFAFVGNQYHFEVGGQDFYIDLLFYHLQLRCFIVIDLKMRQFQPEDSGKMNFYLSAVDDLLRNENDQPSIGLILCREKNRFIAEYAIRNIKNPIGVSDFHLVSALPENLEGNLPSVEQLEKTAFESFAEKFNKISITKDDFIKIVEARSQLSLADSGIEVFAPILMKVFNKNQSDEKQAVLFRLIALKTMLEEPDFPIDWAAEKYDGSYSIAEPVLIAATTERLIVADDDMIFDKKSFYSTVQALMDSETQKDYW